MDVEKAMIGQEHMDQQIEEHMDVLGLRQALLMKYYFVVSDFREAIDSFSEKKPRGNRIMGFLKSVGSFDYCD